MRLQTRHVTNHELRLVVLGIWLALDPDDQLDFIAELRHYTEPGSRLPSAAVAIADQWRMARDLSR